MTDVLTRCGWWGQHLQKERMTSDAGGTASRPPAAAQPAWICAAEPSVPGTGGPRRARYLAVSQYVG